MSDSSHEDLLTHEGRAWIIAIHYEAPYGYNDQLKRGEGMESRWRFHEGFRFKDVRRQDHQTAEAR